jgi:DNA-nicking Smr family endonuclease
LAEGTEEKIAVPKTPPKTEPKPKPEPVRKPPPAPDWPALHPGAAPGVDRNTAASLRKGELPIEATLDLHGFTQGEAHSALIALIARSRAAGHRCVLVVTGKGGKAGAVPPVGGRDKESAPDLMSWRRAPPGADGRTTGVLRANVPRWLNESPLRAHVLAFANARPRHGGEGALYVLIRRVREARAR